MVPIVLLRFTNWVPSNLVSEVEATASIESEKADGLNGALPHVGHISKPVRLSAWV